MKKLFALGDRYIAQSDWKVIAVLKFCLVSLGIIIGVNVPRKHKKPVLLTAAGVFVITYIPLMAKLFKLAFAGKEA